MKSEKEIVNMLAQCSGSMIFTIHPTMEGVVYSEGVNTVVKECQANWLLLNLGMNIPFNEDLMNQEFLVIQLNVSEEKKATLIFEDGEDNILFTEEVGFTNFPLKSIQLWFTNKVLYLPQEH